MTAVLLWSELVESCGSPERARTALRGGSYRRVLRDAYVDGGTADSAGVRVAALRRVLPDDVALSHWTALWAWGLDVLPRGRDRAELLDVTVPRARHLEARPQLRTHCALLPEHELCEVTGLLLVSPARAFVDVCRTAGVVEGIAAGDAALRAGLTTRELIEAVVAGARGLRWVTRAREAVPHLNARSESLMESRFRVGLVLAGGPLMEAQRDLYDEDGQHCGRADLFLDGAVVEYDGREARLQLARFNHDRRRGNAFADLAVEVRRFTADDYYKVPMRQHVAEVRRALALAAERRPRYLFGRDTLPVPKGAPPVTLAEVKAAQARRTA